MFLMEVGLDSEAVEDEFLHFLAKLFTSGHCRQRIVDSPGLQFSSLMTRVAKHQIHSVISYPEYLVLSQFNDILIDHVAKFAGKPSEMRARQPGAVWLGRHGSRRVVVIHLERQSASGGEIKE